MPVLRLITETGLESIHPVTPFFYTGPGWFTAVTEAFDGAERQVSCPGESD